MKPKEFKNLKVGDKVVIANRKVGRFWNREGYMDCWLGETMTVFREPYKGMEGYYVVKMEEDEQCWTWYPEMVDRLASDNKKTVVIKIDGNTITAYSGKDRGMAKCSPDDEFDAYTGCRLALDRLFGKEEKEENKEVKLVKKVRRKAKAGEYVKVIKPNKMSRALGVEKNRVYKSLDFPFSAKEDDFIVIYTGKIKVPLTQEEYVVLEGYQPK